MIQRQYLLPNCTLTLEGLSNSTALGDPAFRPSLDTLMRCECYFSKIDHTLVGGLDFLESLVRATSECSQSWMSGVQHIPQRRGQNTNQVRFQSSAEGQFTMSVPAELLSAGAPDTLDAAIDVPLTTVQLFDLAEAIDQLLADAQTLPNLSPNLQPLSKRQALSGQPLSKRAAPLALGTLSLAVAATAFYFVPIPEISRPKDEPPPTETPAPTTSPSGVTVPGTETSPQPDSPDAASETGTETETE